MFSKRTTILLSAVLALGLLLSACTPANGADPNGQPAKERVRISDTAFQTLWINNEIAKFAIETGYEYPVDIMDMSSAVMWQSMMNGEIDLHTELWRMNTLDLYNQAIDEGSMLDLGEIYDRSTQGFYVPRYVIEGDRITGTLDLEHAKGVAAGIEIVGADLFHDGLVAVRRIGQMGPQFQQHGIVQRIHLDQLYIVGDQQDAHHQREERRHRCHAMRDQRRYRSLLELVFYCHRKPLIPSPDNI